MTSREQPTKETKCAGCETVNSYPLIRYGRCYHCGEPLPAAPTPVPLEPREWLANRYEKVRADGDFVKFTLSTQALAELLESYSSHVNAALMEKLAQSDAELHKWRVAMHDLTAGGSEFVNDLKRCVTYIREKMHAGHEIAKRAIISRKAAESRISELERERDELLAMKLGGKFPQTRDEILTQSFCGVSGHFRFQQNGSSCLMCQRESRLVSKAKSQLSTTQEALRGLFDEFNTAGICDRGQCKHRYCVSKWKAFAEAERVLSPPTKQEDTNEKG